MNASAALAILFPVAAPSPRRLPAMMDRRERPFWAAAIRFARGHEGTFGLVVLGCAIALFAMMAVGTLAAWQSGALDRRPAPVPTTSLPARAGAAGAR